MNTVTIDVSPSSASSMATVVSPTLFPVKLHQEGDRMQRASVVPPELKHF